MGSGRQFKKGAQPDKVYKSGAGPNIFGGIGRDHTGLESAGELYIETEIPIVQLDEDLLREVHIGEIVILKDHGDIVEVFLHKKRLGVVSPAYENLIRSIGANSGKITSVSINPNAAAFRPLQE